MEFDTRALPREHRYKLLASCVAPRPIAWVTTQSAAGVRNAAPYSFFNMVGDEPLTLVLGVLAHREGRLKDTGANIRDTGQFVVNLVDRAHAEAMNLTCIDAPPEVDELALAGVETVPASVVGAPRIVAAPASFECQARHVLETGPNQLVVVAEVVHAHLRDAFVIDAERFYIDTPAMDLVARMHGGGWYARPSELFHLERPSWAQRPQAAL